MLYMYFPKADGMGSELRPVFADGVPTVDATGKIWTIKLKKDAKWADGTPVTADQWLYSWKMQLDPNLFWGTAGTSMASGTVVIKNATEYYNSVAKNNGVKWEDVGLKKVDDYTITVEVTSTYTAEEVMRHFYLRYGGLIKEEIYSKCISADGTTCDYGSDLSKIAFAGQFVVTEWQKGALMVFEKNENWPCAELTHIDKIMSRVVTDESTRLELFEKGEADHITLGTNGMAKYGEDPRVRSYASKTINSLEVNTNHTDPIYDACLSDPAFRQGLFYAIDRNAIAKLLDAIAAPYHLSTIGSIDGTMYREYGPAKALVEKWAPNNNGGYDPAKAKELVFGVMNKVGATKLTLKMIYSETSDNIRIASEYLDSQFDIIFEGKIDIELKATPSSAKNDLLKTSWKTGPVDTWELGWAGWGLAAEDFYPWKKFQKYTSTDSSRYGYYQNFKLDEIYKECLKDENRLDGNKLLDLTVAGESAWYDDMTNIPVYSAITKMMFQERVDLPMNVYTSQTGFGWYYSSLK